MSDMKSFFSAGGVNMLPSGGKNPDKKSKVNWKKALRSHVEDVLDNVKDAFGIGQKSKDAKIATLTPIEKKNAELNYDVYLYDNILNCERSGKNTSDAIEKAHEITLKTFKAKMPKEKTGKDYLVIQHAEMRLAQSSRIESVAFVAGPYPATASYRVYKPEFKDTLKREIDARDYTTQNKIAQMIGTRGR